MVNTVHEGYLTEFSKPVLQYRLGYSKVCLGCVQKCTHFYLVKQDFLSLVPVNYFANVFTNVTNKLFPNNSFTKDTISHCGDLIEGKLLTAVVELKGPNCGMQQKRLISMPSSRSQNMLMKILMTWTN